MSTSNSDISVYTNSNSNSNTNGHSVYTSNSGSCYCCIMVMQKMVAQRDIPVRAFLCFERYIEVQSYVIFRARLLL